MKKSTIIFVVLLALAGPWAANSSFGQTKQTIVIGFGFGGHTFSQVDDARDQFFYSTPTTGVMVELFGEWYPLEFFGIGIRSLSVSHTEILIFGGFEFETTAQTDTIILAANFIPWISSDGYYRFGILAGAGSAAYTVTQTLGGFSASIDTSGTATLGGGYIDWGGDVFGGRFGLNYLSTTFDPLINGGAELSVDGSGTHWYFDLRWAFE